VLVSVDRELCFGHGRCYSLAPDVYEPDDGGYCVIPSARVVDEALIAQARLGEASCPERAIRVASDESVDRKE
jgi:ferredoxin